MSEEQAAETTSEAEGQAPLLDAAEPQIQEGEYFLSEGVKGVGEAPEWFDGNRFKSVDQQAKSYMELEKKFGGFKGAPKEGYELPEGVDAEDEAVKEFINLATESNASQEFFNKGFELFQAQMGVTEEVNAETELKKLGENADQRIKTVEAFLKEKAGDQYEDIQSMVTTADSVALVEKMIQVLAPKKMPLEGGEHPQGLTWEDVEKAMHKKDDQGRLLRSSDPEYNKKVEAMMASFEGQ